MLLFIILTIAVSALLISVTLRAVRRNKTKLAVVATDAEVFRAYNKLCGDHVRLKAAYKYLSKK